MNKKMHEVESYERKNKGGHTMEPKESEGEEG